MAFMKSFFDRIRAAALGTQILAVLVAFGMLIYSSYVFVNKVERGRMSDRAKSSLDITQMRIEMDMDRAEAMISGVADVVRDMFLQNDDIPKSDMERYFSDITRHARNSAIPSFRQFFGYFDRYRGEPIGGDEVYADSIGVASRTWYTAAVTANGNVAFVVNRVNGNAKDIVITCVRRIADADGKQIGIVGMNIGIENITKYLADMKPFSSSMGILHDHNSIIITHSTEFDWNGLSMAQIGNSADLEQFETELIKHRMQYSEHEARSADGSVYVGIVKPLPKYDWYLCSVTPTSAYYGYASSTVWFFLSLNAIILAAMCYILMRLARTKRSTDEFTQLVFDTAPLACYLWNKDGEIVMCNRSAVRMYGARDKQDYINRFYDYSPEYQPSGEPSRTAAMKHLNKAFQEGSSRFEWMHKTVDGKPLPSDISLVRVKYKGEDAIIAYVRDMREEKASLEKMREAEEHIQSVYNTTPLAITMWDAAGSIIDCNTEAIKIFCAKDKNDLVRNFMKNAPDYQPDGKLSVEKITQLLAKAFKEGSARASWEHRSATGETLPFDITFTRLKHKEGYIVVAYGHDMRKINAAMAKIREADERYQILLDAMPVGANFWDKDLKNIDCNLESVRLFDLKSKQEYLDNFNNLSPEFQPDGRKSTEKGQELVKKAFEEGYVRFDWVHQKLNGEQIPCGITLVRVKYKDDYMVAGYTQDLRELNALMAQMREADERAITMLDTAPIGVTMWDRDINLIDFNLDAARVLGINSKQEYRERFHETAPELQPDGTPTGEKLVWFINGAFENGSNRTLWHHRHINGEVIPFDAQAFRVKYKDDEAIIVYCADQREINAANAKLREESEFRDILFNASPVSCTLYDENIVPVECNDETLNLFGVIDKQEFLQNFSRFNPEYQPDGSLSAEQSIKMSRKALTDGLLRFEWTHKNSSGELIPCEVTLVRVKYREKDILACYIRDLREFKAMVREAHRAEIAEESNRAKSRFLAAMSHEIRTPMNVILGVTDIHLQDDTLPPHLREAFMQVYSSSDLLLGIINDILDLSKIEAGKMEFTPSRYVLASLINDAAHLNMMRNSKPIEFDLSIDENAPTHLYGDELRLKQILNNLLSNAFKFTEEGHVKLDVRVEETDADNVTLVLTVSDTGQGMSDEQVEELFSEYTRFNLDTNRAIEGTGLGMNITRRLIGMMNGQISVKSKKGVGTTVTVRLPQKRMSDTRIGKELAENLRQFRVDTTATLKRTQITRDYMPYGRVLIVDDVESNLYVGRGLMASYGLSIDTANSGFEAIDKIAGGKLYDVVFMDHMMPNMDGIETTKRIREAGYTMPIVALTANAVVGQADIFLSNGFDDFISKPIDIRQLNAILNRFIRDKQSPEVLEKAKKMKEHTLKNQPLIDRPYAEPELLKVFARDASKALPIIEAVSSNPVLASDEDIHLFTVNVHAMKSALANIGETRLAQVAQTLESAGKTMDKTKITMQSPSFIKALRNIISVAETQSQMKPPAVNNEDPAFLREQMAIIAEACRDYDERKASSALDALKLKSWTAATEDALVKIAELLLHSSFEEAAELAEQFAN